MAGLVKAGCRVVGADPRPERRALALDLGCEAAFDDTVEDPFPTLLGFDPHGPRVAFECSGVAESLQQVIDACGHQGVIGILGIPMAPVVLLRMTVKEQRAFSIAGPSWESMHRALDLLALAGGRPGRHALVALEDIGRTMDELIEGRGGVKVLVAPGATPASTEPAPSG